MAKIDWKTVRACVLAGDVEELDTLLANLAKIDDAWPLVAVAKTDPRALAVAEWILSRGGTPTSSPRTESPLHLAAPRHPRLVAYLLSVGAKPNVVNRRGHDPLMIAADFGKLRSVRALLAAGADPNRVDPKGGTALLFACDHGHESCAVALLDAGADPSVRDVSGRSPLGLARKHDRTKASTKFLSRLKAIKVATITGTRTRSRPG